MSGLKIEDTVGELEVFLPLEGVIDRDVERQRLEREIDRISRQLAQTDTKLDNEHFVRRAPQAVVAREREKKEDYEANLEKLQRHLEIITVSEN